MPPLMKMALIPVYSKIDTLTHICKSLIGQPIKLQVLLGDKIIPISNTNLVGDLLEDVLFSVLRDELDDFEEGPKQASPDFWGENKHFEFEQKSFAKTPGFDLANFGSYIDMLCEENGVYKKLFQTQYMVFKYKLVDDTVHIQEFGLYRIWQLAGYGGKKPLNVQTKRKMWYNLRPGTVKSWKDTTKTPKKFIDAILASIDACPHIDDKETKKSKIETQWVKILEEYRFE